MQPVKTKGFLKDPLSSKGVLLIAKLKVTKDYEISKKSSISMQKLHFISETRKSLSIYRIKMYLKANSNLSSDSLVVRLCVYK